MHELDVWLRGDRVGTLSIPQGRLQFTYAPDWLQRPDAMPLSCSLPLQTEPFDDARARPFFAGLLPEGRLRRTIARQFHVSGQNDFALLDHIGGECAGAVTFLEPGRTPPAAAEWGVQWLDDTELVELLDELPHRPMLAGKDGLRLSLAGAQDKLPVIVSEGRIGLPLGGAPSTHILKPPIEGVDDSVSNEAFCMALAAAMGLRVAPCRIGSVRERRYLLVERYDRTRDTRGVVRRLHQEDFCQAIGVDPEAKYQNEGGPGLAQCFALLREVLRLDARQVLSMLDYVVFHALTGNHDAHAKNFSLLYTEAGVELAPLYDALSTAVYPRLTPRMAMKLGGKYRFSEVYARHWVRFAEEAGFSASQTRKRILQFADRLPTAALTLQQRPDSGFAGSEVVDRIVRLIAQRVAVTAQRLQADA